MVDASQASNQSFERPSSKIEGGIDAVVIGGTVDGYVAAAMLAKARLTTVLIEAGANAARADKREFAPGFFCDDTEPLIMQLDPEIIDALDLYKQGLSYIERRMETMYFFSDGAALSLAGDISEASEQVAAMSEADADNFSAFIETALLQGEDLNEVFQGGPAPAARTPGLERIATASVDEMLAGQFRDDRLGDLIRAEAAFGNALRPADPFSYLGLVRRLAGEAAGLKAAIAYPANGGQGLANALRRAAQAAGVEIRQARTVKSVLVEWDGAAGVEFDDGGQIRASIIVSAVAARRTFLGQIGASHIDLEFQQLLRQPPSPIAPARVHFALAGAPRDGKTKNNLTRRMVYAPDAMELRRAYRMAHDGEVAAPLILELTFNSMFEGRLAPDQAYVASGWIHPVPFAENPSDELREEITKAAIASFEKIAPGVEDELKAVDIVLASDRAGASGEPVSVYAAAPPVLSAWDRARLMAGGSGIRGYFFCGAEAQIGRGPNGAAGRRAANAAIRFSKGKEAPL